MRRFKESPIWLDFMGQVSGGMQRPSASPADGQARLMGSL